MTIDGKEYKKVIFIVLVITLIFFYPIFISKLPIFADNLIHIAPSYHFFRQTVIETHNLPLWNQNSLNGVPFQADPSHPLFNPFNIIYFIINDIYWAVTIQIILLILLNCVGIYYLCRKLALSSRTSFLCMLFYGFSGSVLASVNDLNSLFGIAYIPWFIAFIIKELVYDKKKVAIISSLILSLQILSGHTQYIFFELISVFCLYLYIAFQEYKKTKPAFNRLFSFCATLLLAIGIASIQLIPSTELLISASRTSSINQSRVGEDRPVEILRYIFPILFGRQNDGTSWGPGSQIETGMAGTNGFISISALIIAIYFFFVAWKKQKKAYILAFISGIVIVLVALGDNFIISRTLHKLLVGQSVFRSPNRYLVFYSLIISVLAGYGIEHMKKNSKNKLLKIEKLVIPIAVSSLVVILLLISKANFFSPLLSYLTYGSKAYSPDKIDVISKLLLESITILLLGLSGIIFIIKSINHGNKQYFNISILLIVVELFLGARGNLVFVNRDLLNNKPHFYNIINKDHEYRAVSTADTQPYTGIWVYFNHFKAREPFARSDVSPLENNNWQVLTSELQMVPANIHLLYGIKSASGYAALIPDKYRRYWESNFVNYIDMKSYDNLKLNEVGVKYIITGVPDDVIADNVTGRYKKIVDDGKIKVYENKDAKPRAQLLNSNNQQLAVGKVSDINTQIVDINVSATLSGRLVMRDFYYPGWNVTVDGVRKDIIPYDTIFRSINLDAGEHLVRFEFKPLSFKIGAFISLLSMLGLSGYLFIARKRYA